MEVRINTVVKNVIVFIAILCGTFSYLHCYLPDLLNKKYKFIDTIPCLVLCYFYGIIYTLCVILDYFIFNKENNMKF